MRPEDYDFELPPEQIAQSPAPSRAASRLLVVDPDADREGLGAPALREKSPPDLPELLESFFPQGYLVVLNNSKVVPARFFVKREDGRLFELLVTAPAEDMGPGSGFWAWVKNAKRLRDGDRLQAEGLRLRFEAEARDSDRGNDQGATPVPTAPDPRARRFIVEEGELMPFLQARGQVPLPPYIRREGAPGPEDQARYQTVYAQYPGSVAAPTAGLHLDEGLLQRLSPVEITLHVGPGTFLPMEAADVREHRVGAERVELRPEAAAAIEKARAEGKAIVAVGTTVARTLEGLAARHDGRCVAGTTEIDLVIAPGHRFLVLSALLTNFHLPRSSLLMLTCTFGGQARVLAAYRHAVQNGFRFYSYGDCMLLKKSSGAEREAGR